MPRRSRIESWDIRRAGLKELMPIRYADKIKREMSYYVNTCGGKDLTEAEIGALAARKVLVKRQLEIERICNLDEVRLESAAKMSWANRQEARVISNKNFISAINKVFGER